jgi:hypothetical protein
MQIRTMYPRGTRKKKHDINGHDEGLQIRLTERKVQGQVCVEGRKEHKMGEMT